MAKSSGCDSTNVHYGDWFVAAALTDSETKSSCFSFFNDGSLYLPPSDYPFSPSLSHREEEEEDDGT